MKARGRGRSTSSFGYSVSLEGDRALIGACQEDTGGSLAGAAYVLKNANL